MSNSDQPHRIKGISFFASRHKKYAGKYIRGRWADQNELVRVPVEEQTGFGFKFDIMFGWTIRPIPMFWKLGWWKNKPTIDEERALFQEPKSLYYALAPSVSIRSHR